jgi:deazaflavin-dependent oxidoreductase (nitroreductase family)
MDEVEVRANWFQRLVAAVSGSRPGAWVFARVLHHVDRAMVRVSGGRMTVAGVVAGLPVVMLTTRGARSGVARTTPVIAVPDGARLIVIASNWGQEQHPGWYYNLRAHPDCVATVGGTARRMRARQVAGEERARCWARAVATYGGFAAYARRATREIGVFVLEDSDE